MKIAKSVLVKISNELKSKSDEQLQYLLNLYSSQLKNLSEKDYEYFGESLSKKIYLIQQEINSRSVVIETNI